MSGPSLVQFLHPGAEHVPDPSGFRGWNRGAHQRTFLRVRCRYVEEGREVEDDLVLWGEWEPPVRVLASFPDATDGCPGFLCEPFLELPDSFEGHQNTDPFVFGDQFLYGICQQHTRHGLTGMQELEPGSIILFGSCRGGVFRLDTVLAVADAVASFSKSFSKVRHC